MVARDEMNADARCERGAALPLVALMMFVLLGLAAFAVDLGWFYLHATRVQRAADAAALAGVIHMPQDFPKAEADALEVASINGYTNAAGTEVAVLEVPDQPTQLEVRITDTVPTFFLKVFGRSEQVITRAARAEYIPPLPLGSPTNQFGNRCDPRNSDCKNQPNFWANIHGKYTQRGMGDAFGPACAGGSGDSCGATNPLYRERGYLYGIEAQPGTAFTIWFVDMEFRNTSGGFTGTSDDHRTGDRGCENGAWGASTSSQCGQTVRTRLYAPDPDPLDVSNNTLLCEHIWTPQPQTADTSTASYQPQSPKPCFTVNAASEGIYVLQVEVLEPSQKKFSGLNRYGLFVEGTNAKLYGLGDISIYNNFSGSVSSFYLAEVKENYRGKTFVVEMFDPGEGNGTVQLMAPDGAGWSVFGSCRMFTRAKGVMTGPWTDEGTRIPCQYPSSTSLYDDRWIRLEVQLPENYTCSSNCWWKINYVYPSGTNNDTTTWRAYIVGNPIHLVPMGGG